MATSKTLNASCCSIRLYAIILLSTFSVTLSFAFVYLGYILAHPFRSRLMLVEDLVQNQVNFKIQFHQY